MGLKGAVAAGHRVTVVNQESFFQYQPFLPEVASGTIDPRAAVVPLRRVLKHCRHRDRRSHARRSCRPRGARADVGRRRADDRLRHRGARPRLSVARAAGPGSRGTRDRIQDRPGGDLPPEPRARAARRRGVRGGRRATSSRAHLRLRGRRIRRRRGARRARGPRARRDRELSGPRCLRDALGPRRRRGPHPPRASGGPRVLRPGPAPAARDRHQARDPARVGRGRRDPALRRASRSPPKRSCGRPA